MKKQQNGVALQEKKTERETKNKRKGTTAIISTNNDKMPRHLFFPEHLASGLVFHGHTKKNIR
jgi:hypothetical protein